MRWEWMLSSGWRFTRDCWKSDNVVYRVKFVVRKGVPFDSLRSLRAGSSTALVAAAIRFAQDDREEDLGLSACLAAAQPPGLRNCEWEVRCRRPESVTRLPSHVAKRYGRSRSLRGQP